jgi:hypothetical protein
VISPETFNLALAVLMDAGHKELSARRIIGVWVRDYAEQDILEAAQAAAGKVDPVGYIKKILQARPVGNRRIQNQLELTPAEPVASQEHIRQVISQSWNILRGREREGLPCGACFANWGCIGGVISRWRGRSINSSRRARIMYLGSVLDVGLYRAQTMGLTGTTDCKFKPWKDCMTKSLLAATLILFALMFASVAFATGWHAAPVIVAPPVVTPPVSTPVASSAPTVANSAPEQAAAGSSGKAMGYAVFAGVAVYFWAVICVKEREVNPDGFWANYMCFKRD